MRIPRKLKKQLKNADKDWKHYLTHTQKKLNLDKQLDTMFTRDYSNPELIQSIVHRDSIVDT